LSVKIILFERSEFMIFTDGFNDAIHILEMTISEACLPVSYISYG